MTKLSARATKNILAGLLTGFAVSMFACFFWLILLWPATAPSTPVPHLGLVYPHNNHGAITYFSAFQATSCALMFLWFPILFFTGWAIAPKKNIRDRVGFLARSMTFDSDDPEKLLVRAQLAGALLAPVFLFSVGPLIVRTLVGFGIVLNLG